MMISKPRVSRRVGLVAGLVLIVSGCGTGASGGDQSGHGGAGASGTTGGQGAGTGGTPGTGGGSATGGSTGTGGTIGTGGSDAALAAAAPRGAAPARPERRAPAAPRGAAEARPGPRGPAGPPRRAEPPGLEGTLRRAERRGPAGRTATGGSTGTGGTPGPALAFPGAQGFAKKVTGGRAGAVYHVTNLNDSGAGSFRDAVSASNRIVVFDVGGYVQLVTAVSAKSNLTIAGQTAPGGGIGFQGGEISFASQSNIIMRHVRIRPGSDTASTEDDALSLYRAHDVIVDHSSMEFAPWNDIDGVSDDWQNYPVTNITIQDSLIADPTGQQFGAHTESVSSDWSWYRNIFANSHNRNPLAKVNNVFVNNVLYNCLGRVHDAHEHQLHARHREQLFHLRPGLDRNRQHLVPGRQEPIDLLRGEPERLEPERHAGRNRDDALLVPGDGDGADQPLVERDHGDAAARHAVGGAGRHLGGGDAAARSGRRADHQPGDDAGERDRPGAARTPSGRAAASTPARPTPACRTTATERSPAAPAPPTPTTTGCPTSGRAPTAPTSTRTMR